MSDRPLPTGIFTVESPSTDPSFGGCIDIRFGKRALYVRWDGQGEDDWMEVPWDEVIRLGGSFPTPIKEELVWIKERAHDEGYKDGLESARSLVRKETRAVEMDALQRRSQFTLTAPADKVKIKPPAR